MSDVIRLDKVMGNINPPFVYAGSYPGIIISNGNEEYDFSRFELKFGGLIAELYVNGIILETFRLRPYQWKSPKYILNKVKIAVKRSEGDYKRSIYQETDPEATEISEIVEVKLDMLVLCMVQLYLYKVLESAHNGLSIKSGKVENINSASAELSISDKSVRIYNITPKGKYIEQISTEISLNFRKYPNMYSYRCTLEDNITSQGIKIPSRIRLAVETTEEGHLHKEWLPMLEKKIESKYLEAYVESLFNKEECSTKSKAFF